MGAGCCSAGGGEVYGGLPVASPRNQNPSKECEAGEAATAQQQRNRSKPAIVRSLTLTTPLQVEDNRARIRERATQSLKESLSHRDELIPTLKWRRQYVNISCAGLIVSSLVSSHLTIYNGRRTTQPTSSNDAHDTGHGIVTLDLRALKMGDDGLAVLAPALLNDIHVRNINFAGNLITDAGAKDFLATFHGVAAQTQIETFTFVDNPISSAGLCSIMASTCFMPALRRIEVGKGLASASMSEIDDPEAVEVLSQEAIVTMETCIDKCSNLEAFAFIGTSGKSLTATDFSPDGLTHFVTHVVSRSKLTELSLQGCYSTKQLPSDVPPYCFPPSPVAVKQQRNGKHIDIPLTTSSDPDGTEEKVAAAYKAAMAPIQALGSSLTNPMTHLRTLTISFPLTDSAVEAFSRGVARARVLENLSVRGCDLTAVGLRFIAKAIRSTKTLKSLDVSFQSMPIAHPSVLADLRNSSRRRQSFTPFSDAARSADGALANPPASEEEWSRPLLPIIAALHQNRSISCLVMLGINICTDDIEELCACIERSGNYVLTEVSYSSIGCEALSMKLESFLLNNKEFGCTDGAVGLSAVSQRSTPRKPRSLSSLVDHIESGEDRSQSSSLLQPRHSQDAQTRWCLNGHGSLHASQAARLNDSACNSSGAAGKEFSLGVLPLSHIALAKPQAIERSLTRTPNALNATIPPSAQPSIPKVVSQSNSFTSFSASQQNHHSIEAHDEATLTHTSDRVPKDTRSAANRQNGAVRVADVKLQVI